MASLEQQIFDKVLARLATISVANGYQTNLGAKVFAWRDLESFAAADLPCVNLKDPSGQSSLVVSGTHDHEVEYWAEVLWANRDAIAADVRKMRADIYRMLGVVTDGFPGPRWSGLARYTDPLGWETGIVTGSNAVNTGGCRFKFSITHRTNQWDP